MATASSFDPPQSGADRTGDLSVILPARRSRRAHWMRAVRALRELLDTPDQTQKAMELTLHLGNAGFERMFQRFVSTPSGRRLLEEAPVLVDTLMDREGLARMEPHSFGAAVLEYLDANDYVPMALVELQHATEDRWMAATGEPPLDPARRWFSDRFLMMHDLFHVLTGYPTDDVGEATLLAFSLAQYPGRANALLTAGATLELTGRLGLEWLRYDLNAWRRGRRATWLGSQPWEELLPMPLDRVCALLEIAPFSQVHPGGLMRDRPAPSDAPGPH